MVSAVGPRLSGKAADRFDASAEAAALTAAMTPRAGDANQKGRRLRGGPHRPVAEETSRQQATMRHHTGPLRETWMAGQKQGWRPESLILGTSSQT
jgi:hypothetical protein